MKVYILFLGIIWGLVGCGSESGEKNPVNYKEQPITEELDKASVSLKIAIPKSLAGTITRVEYIITADDMATIRGDLTLESETVAKGTITGIKEGENRLFTLNAFDGNGSVTHTGSSFANIIAEQSITVRVRMGPIGGTAEIIGEITDETQPGSGTTGGYTESLHPFRITIERLEILPENQVRLTVNFTNTIQDTTLSIWPDDATNVQDNQAHVYDFNNGGWGPGDEIELSPESTTRVFILCRSQRDIETIGTEFAVSIHFWYRLRLGNSYLGSPIGVAVGFKDVRPN